MYQSSTIFSQHLVGVTISNCQVGFDLAVGNSAWNQAQGWGAQAVIDAVVTNTPVFVRQSQAPSGSEDGTIVLNNIQLNNVPTAVGVTSGQVIVSLVILLLHLNYGSEWLPTAFRWNHQNRHLGFG